MRPTVVAAVVYAIVGLLGWAMFTTTTPTAQRAGDLFALTAILGTPLAAAAVILARRLADAAQGDDLAERIVTLVAGGMKGSDGEWGKAMQAELATPGSDGRSGWQRSPSARSWAPLS